MKNSNDLLVCSAVSQPVTPKYYASVSDTCLIYPVCQSDLFCSVLHCHVWPLWQYHIFLHDIIKGTIFEKKIYV